MTFKSGSYKETRSERQKWAITKDSDAIATVFDYEIEDVKNNGYFR